MRPPTPFRRSIPLLIIVCAVTIDLLFIAASRYLHLADIIHLLPFTK